LPVDGFWKITFFNLYKRPSYPQDAQWQLPKGKHKLDVEIDQVTVSRFGMSGGSYVMADDDPKWYDRNRMRMPLSPQHERHLLNADGLLTVMVPSARRCNGGLGSPNIGPQCRGLGAFDFIDKVCDMGSSPIHNQSYVEAHEYPYGRLSQELLRLYFAQLVICRNPDGSDQLVSGQGGPDFWNF
jgi:hypothetical protein